MQKVCNGDTEIKIVDLDNKILVHLKYFYLKILFYVTSLDSNPLFTRQGIYFYITSLEGTFHFTN